MWSRLRYTSVLRTLRMSLDILTRPQGPLSGPCWLPWPHSHTCPLNSVPLQSLWPPWPPWLNAHNSLTPQKSSFLQVSAQHHLLWGAFLDCPHSLPHTLLFQSLVFLHSASLAPGLMLCICFSIYCLFCLNGTLASCSKPCSCWLPSINEHCPLRQLCKYSLGARAGICPLLLQLTFLILCFFHLTVHLGVWSLLAYVDLPHSL